MPLALRLLSVSAAILSALMPSVARAATFQTLVVFDKKIMGSVPEYLSISSQGNIFGTTAYGGGQKDGKGVLFAFFPDSSGKLVRPLYTFPGMPNGEQPSGPVTQVPGGRLFGTTGFGGVQGGGTIFSYDPHTRAEDVLYSFYTKPNGSDGAAPSNGLARGRDEKLYGTDNGGRGSGDCGTVFRFDPKTRKLTTIHDFNRVEACGPRGLTFNGTKTLLYGTTVRGGAFNRGTIFSLDPITRAFTILFSFPGGSSGKNPLAPPAFDTEGNAYGTTQNGVIYKLAAGSNAFSVLAKFPDAADIVAGLSIGPSGILYGETYYGGAYSEGNVFSVVPSTGAVTILHEFNGQDGMHPYSLVLTAQGLLYGTTLYGGDANGGNGSLFEIQP